MTSGQLTDIEKAERLLKGGHCTECFRPLIDNINYAPYGYSKCFMCLMVGVQPMSKPSAQIFTLKYKYKENK